MWGDSDQLLQSKYRHRAVRTFAFGGPQGCHSDWLMSLHDAMDQVVDAVLPAGEESDNFHDRGCASFPDSPPWRAAE